MKQPLTTEQRRARIDRITDAVKQVEDRLVKLRCASDTETSEWEQIDEAFASLYYLRNLARKAP